MATRKPPNAARRSEQSRRAIHAATRELIAEQGYAKLTIEAIAARAGVGKQTIYRWWPSKGALVFDAILALSEQPDGGGVGLPDTGDITADLKAVMRATVEEFTDPAFDATIRGLTTEVVQDPGLAALYREKLAGPLEVAIKGRLHRAQQAGQLAADADLDLVVDFLYGPFYRRWLLGSGPLTGDFADRLVDAVLAAFHP